MLRVFVWIVVFCVFHFFSLPAEEAYSVHDMGILDMEKSDAKSLSQDGAEENWTQHSSLCFYSRLFIP